MSPRPDALIETLREAQRFGFFGPGDIVAAAEHAQAFVEAVADVQAGARLIDLGAGGGLPGLVLADARPDLTHVLLDRRQKRTDFLERAVRRHGWPHVSVRLADVRDVIGEVEAGETARFDVVTARGFGPPEFTLRSATALCRDDGRIVISEPPTENRWSASLLDELALTSHRSGPVRVFTRRLDGTNRAADQE